MSKKNPIPPAAIPEHMLENPVSRAQKKAFAKVKRAEAKDEKAAEPKKSKKSDA